MKTVRFSELVAKGGRPEIHLTWALPQADPVLQKAVKQDRVLTVHQRVRGAKKDYGTVGIEAGPDAQFLIFPRSLRSYAEHRVVGIQYELLSSAISVGAAAEAKERPDPIKASVKSPHTAGGQVAKGAGGPRRSDKPETSETRPAAESPPPVRGAVHHRASGESAPAPKFAAPPPRSQPPEKTPAESAKPVRTEKLTDPEKAQKPIEREEPSDRQHTAKPDTLSTSRDPAVAEQQTPTKSKSEPAERPSRAKPADKKTTPVVPAPAPDEDPIKREIREALKDLMAKRTAKAVSRLKALLLP